MKKLENKKTNTRLMEEVAIANSATMKIKEEKILAERCKDKLAREQRAPAEQIL